MGRECCWLDYPRQGLLSLPASFSSFPVSPQCSTSFSPLYPPSFPAACSWPHRGLCPRVSVPPCASCPTWLQMAPVACSRCLPGVQRGRNRQLCGCSFSCLWLREEGQSNTSFYPESAVGQRSGSVEHIPAEEPYVMQVWCNSGTLCNPLNIVHPQRLQIPLCWDLLD